MKVTPFFPSGCGVAAEAAGVGGALELAGTLNFSGTVVGTSGLLDGGPPDLIDRWAFNRGLTSGSGGADSMTGVGGRWIVNLGAVSSTPRRTRSASLRIHHRTS